MLGDGNGRHFALSDQPTMELDVVDLRTERPVADHGATESARDVVPAPGVVLDSTEPAPPRIDARFVVRRGDVRRQLRKRRRRILVMSAIALVVAAATVGTLMSPLFSISRFDVRGVDRVTSDAVIAASTLSMGDPLIRVDSERAVASIESLPWVSRVEVVRRWPQTVEITVVERQPTARVIAGISAAILADQAIVVEGGPLVDPATPAGSRPSAKPASVPLPIVNLPADTAFVVGQPLPGSLAQAVEFVVAMPASLRARLTAATVSDRGEVTVQFGSCAEILLGSPDDAEAKFVAAETMLGGSVALNGLKRLDLRVPANPRLERGGRCR